MKVYAEFFQYLSERSGSIHWALDADREQFVKLLEAHAYAGAQATGATYEIFLRDVVAFGLSHAGLNRYCLDFFIPRGMTFGNGTEIKLDPSPWATPMTPL